MDFAEAINKVEHYLAQEEAKINDFGCALPNYVNPNIKLKIQRDDVEEHNFGWVFYYNSEKFIETGDFNEALGGNAPLIINKDTGELIITGTAENTAYYIKNYINTGDPHCEA